MNTQRFICRLALVGVVSFAVCGSAWGQGVRRPGMRRYQSSMGEPFVSPYLNLARPGADPGFNYFTLVQPQMQQQRNSEVNASRIQGLNRDVQQTKMGAYGPQLGIRATGGGASYRNYSHFYPSMRTGGGSPSRDYPAPTNRGMGGFGVY